MTPQPQHWLRVRHAIVKLLLAVGLCLASSLVYAIDCPGQSTPFEHQFDSGASWQLCWHIDKHSGLTLDKLHYGAPAEERRMVLESASLAQILLKYDEDLDAAHLLSTPGLGGEQAITAGNDHCGDGNLLAGYNNESICTRSGYLNSLTQVRRTTSRQRHETSLHAWSSIGSHSFEVSWRLSEDGEITPQVHFSGRLNRYTSNPSYGVAIDDSGRLASNATLLFNWRLDFNLAGTPNNDRVEEFEFPARITDVVRRSISVRQLATETLRVVDREMFRGWRIFDNDQSAAPQGQSRIGYYLDPQESGHSYTSRKHNWTQFDFFVTANKDCERLASDNDIAYPGCAASLDYFTDGESLDVTGQGTAEQNSNQSKDLVVWYSVARHVTPSSEDFPAIQTRSTEFKLIPFDWSEHTPFSEPPEE